MAIGCVIMRPECLYNRSQVMHTYVSTLNQHRFTISAELLSVGYLETFILLQFKMFGAEDARQNVVAK